MMEYFVAENSIVRKIWSKSDTILFIFAGAAAEFALNKAVDWLYHTGKLPADPLKRLFSTVSYAREIVFSQKTAAWATISRISKIHAAVEASRNASIPAWAYRDVLFMLIHYSIASFELMERRLTNPEKEEVYNVFLNLGTRMDLQDLPPDYKSWLPVRAQHLQNDLAKSGYTNDLFKQYKKHLGTPRFYMLLESQKLVMPEYAKTLLFRRTHSLVAPLIPVYKLCRKIRLDRFFKAILLPSSYKNEIKALDQLPHYAHSE